MKMLTNGQSFIFELTDLYEKKNIPKVIYCVHALRSVVTHRVEITYIYPRL